MTTIADRAAPRRLVARVVGEAPGEQETPLRRVRESGGAIRPSAAASGTRYPISGRDP